MPIYEFDCEECGRRSELLVRSSQWAGERCPKCGSQRLVKQFSTFSSSMAGAAAASEPSCSGNPTSCGRCGTGAAHSH